MAGIPAAEVDVAAYDDILFADRAARHGVAAADVMDGTSLRGPDRIVDLTIRVAPWGDVFGLLVLSGLPLLLALALFVMHLVSADVPWWAFLVGVGLACVVYLAAGVKVAIHYLRRKPKRGRDAPA